MAKTFDNISEASATNYLFLFAQRTLALQNEPPTPPPLNALGLPYHTCRALWRLLWARVQKHKPKHSTEPVAPDGTAAAATHSEGDGGGGGGGGGDSGMGMGGGGEAEGGGGEGEGAGGGSTGEQAGGGEGKGGGGEGEGDDGIEVATGKEAANYPRPSDKAIDGQGKNTEDTLAQKITDYINDHQDDAAQEDRWRTTMKRETMKRFREQREAINTQGEAIAEVRQAIAEVRQLIVKLVNTKQVGAAIDHLEC